MRVIKGDADSGVEETISDKRGSKQLSGIVQLVSSLMTIQTTFIARAL